MPVVKSEQASSRAASSGVRFLCSSSPSLSILQNLPGDGTIVLFTPTVPPAAPPGESGGGISSVEAGDLSIMDPFEPFGRAISKRHARVRHVPYVPKVGRSGVHVAWIRQASAIIVVTALPAAGHPSPGAASSVSNRCSTGSGSISSESARSSVSAEDRCRSQAIFLSQVAESLRSMRGPQHQQQAGVRGGGGHVPLTNVVCGLRDPTQHPSYDNIILCPSYNPADLEAVATLLMGR